MKKSKKYIDASKLYDKTAVYEFEEAVALVKKMATAKFDETIEAHLRLGDKMDVTQISRYVVQLYYLMEQVRQLRFSYSLREIR